MIRVLQIVICSVMLIACSVTHGWRGSDSPGQNSANFREFSGKQKFGIKLNTGVNCYINYRVKVQSGKLHMVIRSSDRVFVDKNILTSISDSISIKNNSVSIYTLIITGEKAAGSFEIKYGSQ